MKNLYARFVLWVIGPALEAQGRLSTLISGADGKRRPLVSHEGAPIICQADVDAITLRSRIT